MTKVLITGVSGTGKSTVANALAERGYTAFDADNTKGMTKLVDRESGLSAPWPEGFVDWKKYAYNLSENRLHEVLASDKDVFLSVVASNQKRFFPMFNTVIVLKIDDKEAHLKRLQTRDVHEYGQDEQNLKLTIDKAQAQTEEWVSLGAIAIDASKPVNEVVDNILSLTIHEH